MKKFGKYVLAVCFVFAMAPLACEDSDNTVKSLCGNGVIDPGEACDGELLNSKSCETQKGIRYTGQIRCNPNCTGFDTSSCRISHEGGACRYHKDEDKNESKCVNNKIYRCLNDGTWPSGGTDCGSGLHCNETTQKCQPLPTCVYHQDAAKNQYRCEGGKSFACAPNGEWSSEGKSCNEREVCVSDTGRCALESCTYDKDFEKNARKCIIEGEKSRLMQCGSDGFWKASEACHSGQVCNPVVNKCVECVYDADVSKNARKCEKDKYSVCGEDGKWVVHSCTGNYRCNTETQYCEGEACQYDSDASKNSVKCDDKTFISCLSTGHWSYDGLVCAEDKRCSVSARGCEELACTYDEDPAKNAVKCEGNGILVCGMDKKWPLKAKDCKEGEVCSEKDKKCVECLYSAEPKENQGKCVGGKHVVCQEGGKWASEGVACGDGKICNDKTGMCEENKCVYDADASKNASICLNEKLHMCKEDGKWSESGVSCGVGKFCDVESGKCKDVEGFECVYDEDKDKNAKKCAEGKLFLCASGNKWSTESTACKKGKCHNETECVDCVAGEAVCSEDKLTLRKCNVYKYEDVVCKDSKVCDVNKSKEDCVDADKVAEWNFNKEKIDADFCHDKSCKFKSSNSGSVLSYVQGQVGKAVSTTGWFNDENFEENTLHWKVTLNVKDYHKLSFSSFVAGSVNQKMHFVLGYVKGEKFVSLQNMTISEKNKFKELKAVVPDDFKGDNIEFRVYTHGKDIAPITGSHIDEIVVRGIKKK